MLELIVKMVDKLNLCCKYIAFGHMIFDDDRSFDVSSRKTQLKVLKFGINLVCVLTICFGAGKRKTPSFTLSVRNDFEFRIPDAAR